MMRLSRPCFDKPHRCPGWAGGGIKYAKKTLCDGGSIRTRVPMKDFPGEYEYPGTKRWRFGHCTKCDVVTWPVAMNWFFPAWWGIEWRHIQNWRR